MLPEETRDLQLLSYMLLSNFILQVGTHYLTDASYDLLCVNLLKKSSPRWFNNKQHFLVIKITHVLFATGISVNYIEHIVNIALI